LAEGISPWAFHNRIITSVEYLKRSGVYSAALRMPWDVIVVDEAHYLAESGSPAYPYSTRRTRLGSELRKATRSLILLTATPHNGYRHSFRSLLELIEPTEATLAGDEAAVRRRVGRTMIRRLKQQITRSAPDGSRVSAFIPRAPVERIEVRCESEAERRIFELVAKYCARTAEAAADSDRRDLVSFAMQIVKKRMLSSRLALARTVQNRLEALRAAPDESGPTRGEVRELQGDLPLPDEHAERLVSRVIRTSVPADARRRNAEQRQLRELKRALDQIGAQPDPKVAALISGLRTDVLEVPGEKAIVFTEYRDSLEAVRSALQADPDLADHFVELPGGLSARQRRERIARFAETDCLILLATDAASEGLNLQEHCRRLYHVELPWNPNRLEQRNGRVDRYGQQRTPHIAYLFYADSPEDRILDRLVHRISQMQDDRVSTPDILGLVEATRVPDRLLAVESGDDEARELASLNKVFDEEYAAFAREIAPLLSAATDVADSTEASSLDATDNDDIAFETAMRSVLGPGVRSGGREHEYAISVPPLLHGPGVCAQYDRATFRRTAALATGADGAEFIHRLHPLALAAARSAKESLRASGLIGATVPPYLAVRRVASAIEGPAAIFTYLDRVGHPDGQLLTVGVQTDLAALSHGQIADALAASDRPGNVPWDECHAAFASHFDALQQRAAELAMQRVVEHVQAEQSRREAVAEVLRAEIATYREDRVRELEREEAAERAGARDQVELFREARVDWAARRAAVATQADARLVRIAEWVAPPTVLAPEPLGVLLVFPEGSR